MKRRTVKSRLGATAAVITAALSLAIGVTAPAYAINENSFIVCMFDAQGEYLSLGIRNDNGTGTYRCFANAGQLDLRQSGVERFSSGNNAGYIEYEPGDGYVYRHYFGKWETETANDITVTKIVIY